MAVLNSTLCKCIVICLIIQCVFHSGEASELSRHKRGRTFDVASSNKGNSQGRPANTGTTTEKIFNIIKAGRNCPPGTTPDHNDECKEEALYSALPPKQKPQGH